MALYDNKYWLLSHIRNSFISTDDTGMCELVMVGESKEVKQHLGKMETFPEPDESEDDEDDFESYDLQMDMDFGIRERSNTAAQLEKLDQMRKRTPKMRHVKWETSKEAPSEDLDDLFVKKDVSQVVQKPIQKSMLSVLIENFSHLPKNPYIEYSKFDGSGQVNIPTRKYKIYLTMLPPQQRNYPIHICCVATAKIQDLIGLILLKFSTNQGDSDLSLKPVTSYGLYICEEDGEVDRDFPCLDAKECIAKFGFNCLGLVEHKETFKSVSFPDDSQNVSTVELTRIRTTSEKSKADENRQKNDMIAMDEHNKRMEAPLYQSFQVFMLNKVRPKVEVHLGISGERIEIDPVQPKSSKFMPFKQKAISHHMDTVAWCEITDIKNNRSTFRLVYNSQYGGSYSSHNEGGFSGNASSFPPSLQSSTSFKNYDFECDSSTAHDIVQKMKLILEPRSSSTKRDYIASREKKYYKRRHFSIGK